MEHVNEPKRSDFDLDLRFGEDGEALVKRLLTANIETVEVKSDRRWKDTGNLYIETQCWSHNNKCWYQSGVNATKASHWAFNLEGLIILVEVEKIRNAISLFGREIKCEIPPNYSVGFLITVDDLLRIARW